jgi:hypothetical protein
LDIVLPLAKAILEMMTSPERPWEDLRHKSYFLPELSRVEKGEFQSTMIGYVDRPLNPLETHGIYVEGNMTNI